MQDDAPPDGFELRESSGFTAHIGPLYRRREAESYVFGLRLAARHMNLAGVAHGGLLTAFADNCLGETVYRTVKAPCTTITLTASFVAPGHVGDWVECSGVITRATASLVFISGRVWCADRTLLATQGIWKLLRQ